MVINYGSKKEGGVVRLKMNSEILNKTKTEQNYALYETSTSRPSFNQCNKIIQLKYHFLLLLTLLLLN